MQSIFFTSTTILNHPALQILSDTVYSQTQKRKTQMFTSSIARIIRIRLWHILDATKQCHQAEIITKHVGLLPLYQVSHSKCCIRIQNLQNEKVQTSNILYGDIKNPFKSQMLRGIKLSHLAINEKISCFFDHYFISLFFQSCSTFKAQKPRDNA